jgi:hypothetical protein
MSYFFVIAALPKYKVVQHHFGGWIGDLQGSSAI